MIRGVPVDGWLSVSGSGESLSVTVADAVNTRAPRGPIPTVNVPVPTKQ